jgi:hypothetical protein
MPREQRSGYPSRCGILGNCLGLAGESLGQQSECDGGRVQQECSLRSGDVHLYTITTNQVLRIYAPVLDDPSWFQLLSSSDAATFEPETTGPHISVKGRSKGRQAPKLDGSLWIPDAGVMRRALADTLKGVADSAAEVDAETRKTLETLDAEENDVVAWCRGDGSLTLRLINVSSYRCAC